MALEAQPHREEVDANRRLTMNSALYLIFSVFSLSCAEIGDNVPEEFLHTKSVLPTVEVPDIKLTRARGHIYYDQKFNGIFKPSPECNFQVNGLKAGDYGNITTPNYPRDYPITIDCLWTIESEPGTVIRGVIFDFETQSVGNNSVGDPVYLSKDGSFSRYDRMVGDLNDHTPMDVDSEKNKLVVRFRSDVSETYRGFNLVYNVSNRPGVCGQQNLPDTDFNSKQRLRAIENPNTTEATRVLGFNPTAPHQYPWMVALLIDGQAFCGGTIIDSRHILTAAHCTHRSRRVTVVLGAHNLTEPNEPSRRIMRVTGDNIINHPEYLFNENTITHDIAILRLPQDITFTDKISPVCLPNRRQLRNFNVGETVRLSGWGQTSDRPGISPVLQHTNPQTIMSNKECRATFEHYISGNIICMDATPTNAGCRGDSGGPMFTLIETRDSTPAHIVQYGVTSFTGVSCEQGDPFAFSRVTAFLKFIEEVTGRK